MDQEQRMAALEAKVLSLEGELQIMRRRIQAMETARGGSAGEPATDRQDIEAILARRKKAKDETKSVVRTRGTTRSHR